MDSAVQLSGADYFLQPKSALILEAVPPPSQLVAMPGAAGGGSS